MRSALYTLSAAVLGCAALWQATDGLRAITAEGARRVAIAHSPEPVPAITLETMSGDKRQLTQGTPTLIEFIYTTCPTICQASGGDFAELRDHLQASGLDVPMISVSFDPERDDLDALRNYADLHSATGQPWTIARPQIADLPELLDTFRVTVIPDNWGGYEHNIAVLLINSDGKFTGVFDTRAFDDIAQAVEQAL
ncbi:SCO family protein [uncultured Roseobacter sp.]|uniref:SCO family protein n=1 Tax=uncultured Roseobacter sp. TaxID=114847 RepID=UPI002619A52C|nr:SCO family protein [uncultured Roseobacter sp.]